jgi:hypothetical protein
LRDKMSATFLKPAEPGAADVAARPQTSDELEAEGKSANDKERLIGLIAAPVGGIIAIVIGSVLISHDPAAYLANGKVNKLHVSVSLYHEVEIALLGLALAMMVASLLRKRLYMGVATALFGLTVFNLHYWGFGVPYLMVGSWLLVRSYRIQKSLKEANGGATGRSGTNAPSLGSGARPRPNKRYTPPTGQSRV